MLFSESVETHSDLGVSSSNRGPIGHQISPYDDNGGTSVAIAGEDYAILASDTRQSQGYSINSRYAPKCWKLTETAVLASCGFYGDATELQLALRYRLRMYEFDHDKPMPTPALAQMLSITLYSKRFFPYYVHNILAGVDEQGKGCVFNYDPVGSFERYAYQAAGSAVALIQPFLDNKVGFKNTPQEKSPPFLPLSESLKLVKDAFTSATERDIYTGDQLEIFIITKDGVKVESYPLKRD